MSERIVAPRLVEVSGVQIDHVVASREGNTRSDPFCQIAEGINQSKTISVCEVLEHHPFKKRRLPGASLSDDIDMSEAVLSFYSEQALVISVINPSQIRNVSKHPWSVSVLLSLRMGSE